MIPRFVVFAVAVGDKLLIENRTDSFLQAVGAFASALMAGYRTRLWDNKQCKFLSDKEIDDSMRRYVH